MKALIVEDDPVQRDCLEEYLRPRGCWTDSCASNTAALLRVRVSMPDVIILDYVLPDTPNGGLKSLRAVPKGEAVPVIVTTAMPPGDELDALKADIDAHPPAVLIHKPFAMRELFETMCEMTGKCELAERA